MIILGGYVLFCFTTAIMSTLELLMPVLASLKESHKQHNLLQYQSITYVAFFSMALLVAPILFLPCIIPSMGERFKKAMLASFLEDEKI